MPCALVIDQSTSGTKVALVNSQGGLLDKASREHSQLYPRAGWVEHDGEQIWTNTLAAGAEVLRRNPDLAMDVALVSITNQRETVIAFDRQSGRPLHNAIVWQCQRGNELCARQITLGREAAVRERTGLRIDGYFSAPKLQWLMRNADALSRAVARGDAVLGTIDSYLICRLTEGSVVASDPTNASRTLLFDIRKMRWDAEFCGWWNVPIEALPEVRPCDAQFGQTDFGGLLPGRVPIRGVMGDSQAALFGHGCFEAGSAKVTLGTGSSVLLNAGDEIPAEVTGSLVALAWVRAGVPTYALEGIVNCAAASLNWLRDQLKLEFSLDTVPLSARHDANEPRVYLVPAFSGLGAPHCCSNARGAIVGLNMHHGKDDVVKAALEAIAYQARDVLDMMGTDCGFRIEHIHCDGGPTVNRPLMQFMADILGVKLRIARHPDGSARGTALMGLLGAGVVSSTKPIEEEPSEVFERQCDPAHALACYAGWQRAVRQVLCA